MKIAKRIRMSEGDNTQGRFVGDILDAMFHVLGSRGHGVDMGKVTGTRRSSFCLTWAKAGDGPVYVSSREGVAWAEKGPQEKRCCNCE